MLRQLCLSDAENTKIMLAGVKYATMTKMSGPSIHKALHIVAYLTKHLTLGYRRKLYSTLEENKPHYDYCYSDSSRRHLQQNSLKYKLTTQLQRGERTLFL